MDILQAALYANLATLFICFGSASYLAWQNARSKNLALSTGALAAAMILFVTQLRFELRPTTAPEFITTELTVDRDKPQVRQWVYGSDAPWRITAEVYASDWLAAHNPDAFLQDREKLTADLVLFSLTYSLQTPEFQVWEVRKHAIVVKSAGGIVRFHPTSKERQCKIVLEAELQSKLSMSGNVFAGAPLHSRSICLPPGSVLEISANSLIIRNPMCQVSFTVEPSGGVNYLNPGRGEELPKLPNGESRFETRAIGLDVETTFFALRAQHIDHDKYRDWAARVVSGARDWFEK